MGILSVATATNQSYIMIGWILLLGGFMYFFMIRPQKKAEHKKREMLNAMEVGDTILTTSGFYGVIIDIQDDTVIVEFGNNKNCRIPMQKAAVSMIEKPEDAVTKKEEKKDKNDKK